MKKKVLLSSIATIAVCLCLIVGSTFALFTSTDAVDVAVTSGKVVVTADLDTTLKTWSLGEAKANARTDGTFTNGGVAAIEDGVLVIERMTPGDSVEFTIHVKNTSDVAAKYKLNAVSVASDDEVADLSEALSISAHVVAVDGVATTWEENYTMAYSDTADERSFETSWFSAPATDGVNGEEILTITVVVTFPNGAPEHDNLYQSAAAKLAFTVTAVQGNGVDANGDLITP